MHTQARSKGRLFACRRHPSGSTEERRERRAMGARLLETAARLEKLKRTMTSIGGSLACFFYLSTCVSLFACILAEGNDCSAEMVPTCSLATSRPSHHHHHHLSCFYHARPFSSLRIQGDNEGPMQRERAMRASSSVLPPVSFLLFSFILCFCESPLG